MRLNVNACLRGRCENKKEKNRKEKKGKENGMVKRIKEVRVGRLTD
jgi:hypothetical protein